MKHSLNISLSDLWRTTLEDRSGNVGFIGLAPDGSGYHVVVPVDLQIARGVKAGNRPTDGTPFGGYRGWHYFQCRPFSVTLVPEADRAARAKTAGENGRSLVAWAAGLGLAVQVVDDHSGRVGQ